MLAAYSSVLYVVLSLVVGLLFAKVIPAKYIAKLLKLVTPIVYLLLFLMGLEMGEVFLDLRQSTDIIMQAALLALLTTIITFIVIPVKLSGLNLSGNLLYPLISCSKALLFFVLGILCCWLFGNEVVPAASSDCVLYFLIALIGLDLSHLSLRSISAKYIKLPLQVILATYLAALVFSWLTNKTIAEALLISSGFGWFSLSGPLITSLKGIELGSLALLNDLFRELISIVFLFIIGRSAPRAAIGLTAATALDSALPFIKDNCDAIYIKDAIVSGFILTILAPVAIPTIAFFIR